MKIILHFFLFLGFLSAYAQKPTPPEAEDKKQAEDFHPCGTADHKSAWLKAYQKHAPSTQRSNLRSGTTYLPMSIQLVGNDDSTGFPTIENVLSSFCKLNEDFSNSDIQFFIQFPIHYIPNTAFNTHDSVSIGGRFMLEYNVDSSINVYFVNDPAGNCGYNLPYAGVAMNTGCLGGHTFAHELGHNLHLPHTFLGWEGGVSWDDSLTPNFSDPAPTLVTINYTDFKDTLWTDTLIIDTIQVEYVARTGGNANCSTAADGFCDTPADYLAYRWPCNTQNNFSTVQQLDPDSIAFISDGNYIMSYAFDNCQSIFSTEQKNAMYAFVQSERQNLLYNQTPILDSLSITATLNNPISSSTVDENAVFFQWDAVPGATHYILSSTKFPGSYGNGALMEKIILTDTFYHSSMHYTPRPSAFPYAWKVRAFNQSHACSAYSAETIFNTTNLSRIQNVSTLKQIYIFPNPRIGDQDLQITLHSANAQQLKIALYNSTGQIIQEREYLLTPGKNMINYPIEKQPTGLYQVILRNEQGYTSKRLLIKK